MPDPQPLPGAIDGRVFRAGARSTATHRAMGYELGIPLETVVIGSGRKVTGLYCDWARLREAEWDGVLLVHLGWRSVRLPADPERALPDAMAVILARSDTG